MLQNSPQDPSQMKASLTPAFMNQPQYQQQMQGLAMQVRQQEEGTKKIKKFLKAYEDIQLSAPMGPPQAPQQPGFMQPPGGAVQSMNNNLPRNEPQYEDAPTSFTEMAGGQIPAEGEDDMTSYSEAPIGAEEAGYSNASNEGGGEEWDQGFKLGPAGPPPTGRDKSEDGTPLEHRGDWDAARGTRQEFRKREAANSEGTRAYGEVRAKLIKAHAAKEHQIDEFNRVAGTPEYEKNHAIYDKRYDNARDRLAELEGLAEEHGIDIDDPDFQRSVQAERQKMGRQAKATPGRDPENDPTVKRSEEPKEIKTKKDSDKEFKKEPQGLNKKLDRGSRLPARAANAAKSIMGTGLKAAILGGTTAANMFPPEDAEIFLGRINKDKDFNRLNAREKAAVQKFLEYKAESDSIDARVDVPKGRSGRMDEPIEYSSADKVKRSQ